MSENNQVDLNRPENRFAIHPISIVARLCTFSASILNTVEFLLSPQQMLRHLADELEQQTGSPEEVNNGNTDAPEF